MRPPPRPAGETDRLMARERYAVLDTLPEQALDDLTALAANICDAPIALISLVDERRQWFKAKVGLSAVEIPRDVSFCGHAILDAGLFIVPDALLDERFADNPLVTGEPHIRFYAGAPLITTGGHALGTLCVIDRVPRDLNSAQQRALTMLSRQAMTQLEARRQTRELVDSEALLFEAFRSCPVGVAITRWRDHVFVDVNEQFTELLGWTRDDVVGRTSQDIGLVETEVADRLRSRLATLRRQRDEVVTVRTRSGETLRLLVGMGLADFRGEEHAIVTFVDVTGRQQAEETLREHKDHLAAIIESEPECVKVLDGEGRLVEMNRAGLAMLEVDSLIQAQERPLLDFLLPEHRAAFASLHHRVACGESGTLEFEIQGRRGTRRWLETHATPLRSAGGDVRALLGVTRDVTEQRRADARVRQLNRLYAVLSDINQTIVRERLPEVMLAAACRIAVETGGFVVAWVGLVDTVEGSLRIVGHAGASDDTLQLLNSLLGNAQSGPDCHFTFHALRSGQHAVCNDIEHDPGAASWCVAALERGCRAMASLPLVSGTTIIGTFNLYASEPGFFNTEEMRLLDGLAADIAFGLKVHEQEAERRRVELELRDTEERFRELAENVQEVFWMTGPDQRSLIYVSPAYERIWGRTCASLYDDPEGWLRAVHADDRDQVMRAYSTMKDDGFDATYRILQPDGTVRWIHDRGYPVREPSGEVRRFVGTAEDITERRHLEEQFRHAHKMEAVGRLAGGVAHDINNILTIIQGYGSLLMVESPVGETADAAEQIVLASERAADLTRQLLAFGRRQVLQPRLVDINEVVSGVSRMLQRMLGADVRLRLALHPGPLFTQADSGMLDQVLMNLVINAREAMPHGGDLLIETAEEEGTPADSRGGGETPGRHLRVRVTDSGAGIAPENLARVFEPFFTTKEQGKGTGLGLAIVFGIVEQHGGAVAVRSEVGRGTTFEFRLVVANDETSTGADLSAAPAVRKGTETILLVEDEPGVRMLTRAVLERQGYQVLEASYGAQALQVWEQHGASIRLLLTDVVMPEGMSGRELAARLRASDPDIRVIFMSGYSQDIAGRELSPEERDNFLQKPFSPQQLLETVARHLDG